MPTSTTCHRAWEKVSFSPAVNDGLVVDVLDHTVCSAAELYLQQQCLQHENASTSAWQILHIGGIMRAVVTKQLINVVLNSKTNGDNFNGFVFCFVFNQHWLEMAIIKSTGVFETFTTSVWSYFN